MVDRSLPFCCLYALLYYFSASNRTYASNCTAFSQTSIHREFEVWMRVIVSLTFSTGDKLIYIRRTRHSGWLLNVRAMVPNSFKSIESRIDRTLRKKSIPTLNDNNTCSHQTFYYNFDRCSRAEVCRVKVKVNEHQHQLPVWRSFETVHKDSAFTFEPPMGPRVAVGLTMTHVKSCRQVFVSQPIWCTKWFD